MKRLFVLVVLFTVVLAPYVFAGGGQELWTSDTATVFEGQSEIFFSYFGPTGVKANVYEDNAFIGHIETGQKRRIVSDGVHTYEIRPAVTNSSSQTEEYTMGARKIDITARSNKVSILVRIENKDGKNIVTECTQSEKVTIMTKIKPQNLAFHEAIDQRLFDKITDDGLLFVTYKLKAPNNFTQEFLITGVEWDEVTVQGVHSESGDIIFGWTCVKNNITQDEYIESIFNMLYAFHIKGLGDKPPENPYTEERKIGVGVVFVKPDTTQAIIPFYNPDTMEGGFSATANVNLMDDSVDIFGRKK
jgi:hypothetical protein